MKAKFNTLTGILIGGIMAFSCSAPRYANAQQPDEYNNQPPADDQQQYNDQDDQTDVDQQQDVDFNTFYDALAPYGQWENDPEYGQVWVNNDADFVPYYSDGNWAYSDAGWTWASNYSWGWAPFHYGRWAFRNRWVWVPGYEWAPAWVSWRTGGDYYGWAPLGPGISIGIGASFGGYIAADHWNFCPRQYITSGRFNSYCLPRNRNVTIIRNTTIINNVNTYRNTRFVAGPDRRDVERYTGRRINAMQIRNMNRPGATRINRNSIQMYRPNVRQGNINRDNNRFQQRPNMQNQRPVQQQPNINRQQREHRPVQNNPVPYRPNQQQPANQQPRQPVYNRPQQNTINNRNNNNNLPDRSIALNTRPQYQAQPRQEYRQPERQQVQQPRERPQFQQVRPQQNSRPQQQFSRPQQQQVRPQFQQARPQAQPRNNDGGQNRNGGGRERNNRRA